jgi:hypothetical protein
MLLPWHRDRALEGFRSLAATEDVALFTTRPFEELAGSVILADATAAIPVVLFLLEHQDEEAREHGARLATFAATDAGEDALLAETVSSTDIATRRGAAAVLADRARWVTDPVVHESLMQMFDDDDQTVREAAARVVMRLRGADLTQYQHLLLALIRSRALAGEIPQLAFTLEGAPGEIDEITLELAQKFLELFDNEISDIQTRAAGDARQIGQLVLRAYAQASLPQRRGAILDVVDRLLELNAYGFAEALEEVGRGSD